MWRSDPWKAISGWTQNILMSFRKAPWMAMRVHPESLPTTAGRHGHTFCISNHCWQAEQVPPAFVSKILFSVHTNTASSFQPLTNKILLVHRIRLSLPCPPESCLYTSCVQQSPTRKRLCNELLQTTSVTKSAQILVIGRKNITSTLIHSKKSKGIKYILFLLSWKTLSVVNRPKTTDWKFIYPVAKDLLNRLRIIKHHKPKIRELSTTVDAEFNNIAIACKRKAKFLGHTLECSVDHAYGCNPHPLRGQQSNQLTLEKVFKFRFIHIMGKVPNKQLMTVWVSHNPPGFHIALFTLANLNRKAKLILEKSVPTTNRKTSHGQNYHH